MLRMGTRCPGMGLGRGLDEGEGAPPRGRLGLGIRREQVRAHAVDLRDGVRAARQEALIEHPFGDRVTKDKEGKRKHDLNLGGRGANGFAESERLHEKWRRQRSKRSRGIRSLSMVASIAVMMQLLICKAQQINGLLFLQRRKMR